MFLSQCVSESFDPTVFHDLCPGQATDGVSSSYDALVELFECIANFLERLRIYTDIPLTTSMTDIIAKIMAELLSVFALSTKQIKQGRFSEWIVTCNTISQHGYYYREIRKEAAWR